MPVSGPGKGRKGVKYTKATKTSKKVRFQSPETAKNNQFQAHENTKKGLFQAPETAKTCEGLYIAQGTLSWNDSDESYSTWQKLMYQFEKEGF